LSVQYIRNALQWVTQMLNLKVQPVKYYNDNITVTIVEFYYIIQAM